MVDNQITSPTPHLPEYRRARHFLRILDGVSYDLYRSTYNAIWEQRGSPQEQVDWSDPDGWISERLSGEEQALASRIWTQSSRELNPRYMRGSWYLSAKHDLLQRDDRDTLRITERGRGFVAELTGPVVGGIDRYEGLLTILQLVAERGPGKRSDFLADYVAYCHVSTTYRSESVIKGALHDRLANLIDRGYVTRRGQTYEITDDGLAYLEMWAALAPGPRIAGKQSQLRRIARDIGKEARGQLSDHLATMDPFRFEQLIKLLLEEMGYNEVNTTSPTNDKGVDVVANIELGISSVREVVQVKRHKGNINRTVLDQLRGCLHRFDAVRGTIITTGGFSKGTTQAAFERGAAPITLIDGVDSDGEAVKANGTGNVLLESVGSGDITLNASVSSGSGNITILTPGNVIQQTDGSIQNAGSGSIDVEAGGAINMTAPGPVISTGGGNVRLSIIRESMAFFCLSLMPLAPFRCSRRSWNLSGPGPPGPPGIGGGCRPPAAGLTPAGRNAPGRKLPAPHAAGMPAAIEKRHYP